MKSFTKGLITGILLTASAMMFMGAVAMQNYDDYYDRKIYDKLIDIETGGVYCYDGDVSCD